MSFCKVEGDGKDRIVFLTKEDYAKQPVADIAVEVPVPEGPILPSGEMNWACPCHGSMAYGPCANEYRQFVTTCIAPQERTDDNVRDCFQRHQAFETCLHKYPTLYPDLQMSAGGDPDEDGDVRASNPQQDSTQNGSPSENGNSADRTSGNHGDRPEGQS